MCYSLYRRNRMLKKEHRTPKDFNPPRKSEPHKRNDRWATYILWIIAIIGAVVTLFLFSHVLVEGLKKSDQEEQQRIKDFQKGTIFEQKTSARK